MHTMTKGAAGAAGAGGILLAGAIAFRPGTRANREVRRTLDHAGRRLRYLGGRLQGVGYRAGGHHPDPDVTDNVLADRVRSTLGSLERQLDLPRVHVMAENHTVLLHGDVPGERDAARIERAAAAVSGVAGVQSHLHVGLTPGETRPSAGRAVHPPSPALTRLLVAAEGAGVPADATRDVVGGVLAALAERLPKGERDQVLSRLPADVRGLFLAPRRSGRARAGAPARSVGDFVGLVSAATHRLPRGRATETTAAVLQALRALVPDGAAHVTAVLPAELRRLWHGTVEV